MTNLFYLKITVSPLEKSRHIFVLEKDTVRWAIGKFRNYLWGKYFMVLSYCSVLQIFYEKEDNVIHIVHR